MRTIQLEQRVSPAEPVFEDRGSLDERVLLEALRAFRNGDFRVRLPEGDAGIWGTIAATFNDILELNQRTAQELRRIGHRPVFVMDVL